MTNNPVEEFKLERLKRVNSYMKDQKFVDLTRKWEEEAFKKGYVYNFEWLGRPVIQYPQDIIIVQEVINEVNPDIIIEIGVAHGGSIIFSASILELLGKKDSFVLGIDVDIREHNKKEIEKSPMFKRIKLVEGSSIDQKTVDQIEKYIDADKRVMVILDSMHTHEHVLKELNIYSKYVSKNSYIIVQDTHIEDLPDEFWDNRPWSHGNSPKTAVFEFIEKNANYEVDNYYEDKAMITCAKSGFLKRLK